MHVQKDMHRDRVYVVTGAASGIGRGIAELLAAEGAKLVLADISENVSNVANKIGAVFVKGDLTKAENCEKCVEKAIQEYGNIDGAIMAAGIVDPNTIAGTSLEDYHKVMDVNVTSPFLLSKAVIAKLREQGNGGSLVYIGSKDAFDAVPGVAAYSISKAALLQLAKTVALEEGKYGIRSNVVHPDVVIEGSSLWSEELRANRSEKHGVDLDDLPEHYRKRNALGIILKPEDMAYAVSFLMSNRAAAISGAVISVDGGYGPAFPR